VGEQPDQPPLEPAVAVCRGETSSRHGDHLGTQPSIEEQRGMKAGHDGGHEPVVAGAMCSSLVELELGLEAATFPDRSTA
jgi:hypothetical protein